MMNEINRVSRNTSVVSLAGYILRCLEVNAEEPVLLHAIGASSISQTVKSRIRAKNILAQQNKKVIFDEWFTVNEIDGAERTGIIFSIALL